MIRNTRHIDPQTGLVYWYMDRTISGGATYRQGVAYDPLEAQLYPRGVADRIRRARRDLRRAVKSVRL